MVPTLDVGGAERMVTDLLPRLTPARIQASLLCTGPGGELFNELQSSGIEAIALNASGKRNAAKALLRLFRYMRNTKPDIVVAQGAGSQLIGRFAAILNKVEHRVLWVHNSTDVGGLLRRMADRSLTRKTSLFLGVAEAQKTYMMDVCRYPAEKVRIVLNGVDVRALQARDNQSLLEEFGVRPDQLVVAMVARLHPVKDHLTFINAAEIVLQSLPETQFLIVGDGPQRSALERVRREKGIEQNVHFVGMRNDIDRVLNTIDIFVLNSHSEGLPLSVLEAMACGRPVVCTDVGGISEIVEHGVSGFLTPPRSPAQVARQLEDLLTDPDLRIQIGTAGRERVEANFKLSDTVTEIEEILAELAQQPPFAPTGRDPVMRILRYYLPRLTRSTGRS